MSSPPPSPKHAISNPATPAPPQNPLATPRSSSLSSAFLEHVSATSEAHAQQKQWEAQQKQWAAQQALQQKQWALQQTQHALSLKKLQDELQAFIKAKQQQQQQQQSGPSSALVLDSRLQQVQQTQADKKSLEASMEYGAKINDLRRENEDLKGEIQRRDAASSNSTSSSSSFVYGLMELLLILQPNLVINAISSPSFELKPHFTNHPNSTLLFADISGYTALAQSLGAAGAEGTEALSSALDQFFGIAISSIYHFGGDVVKFCGDAILCVFSPDRTVSPAQAA
ncbi:hypothetical protein TeGR_g7385, partial [Tetraparma gracilis]